MKYFTELFEGGGPPEHIGTAWPRAASEPLWPHRPEAVHVSPEQWVAPEVSPEDAPSVPAARGE